MKNGESFTIGKNEKFVLYAQDPFTEEWREVKEVNFEEGNFVFKGEHFGNDMNYFHFKVEIKRGQAD